MSRKSKSRACRPQNTMAGNGMTGGIGLLYLAAIARGPNAYDLEEITLIVAAVEDELRKGHFALLGSTIAALPLDRLSSHVLVTILRVASSARDSIPRWNSMVLAVRATLIARNLNADKLLRGLF
jgi:hypothetical protein